MPIQAPVKSDPRRLPRRNHYQEGPGFLFVATQGGRRREDGVDRARAAIVRRRRAALRRWADGEPLATICGELRCGRASLFRWRTRFKRGGLEGLIDQPRVGRASVLPPALERLILPGGDGTQWRWYLSTQWSDFLFWGRSGFGSANCGGSA
jgi:hypothetical protein